MVTKSACRDLEVARRQDERQRPRVRPPRSSSHHSYASHRHNLRRNCADPPPPVRALPRAGVPASPPGCARSATRTRVPDKYAADVLCFDMNSIVHTQLRRSKNESHAFVRIFRQLHATMRVRAAEHVFLAPTARSRRWRRSASCGASRRLVTEKGLSPLYGRPVRSSCSGRGGPSTLLRAAVHPARQRPHLPRLGAETPGEGEFKRSSGPRPGPAAAAAAVGRHRRRRRRPCRRLGGCARLGRLGQGAADEAAAKEGIEPRVWSSAPRQPRGAAARERWKGRQGRQGRRRQGRRRREGGRRRARARAGRSFALCGNDYLPKVRDSTGSAGTPRCAAPINSEARGRGLPPPPPPAASRPTPVPRRALRVTAACAQRQAATCRRHRGRDALRAHVGGRRPDPKSCATRRRGGKPVVKPTAGDEAASRAGASTCTALWTAAHRAGGEWRAVAGGGTSAGPRAERCRLRGGSTARRPPRRHRATPTARRRRRSSARAGAAAARDAPDGTS